MTSVASFEAKDCWSDVMDSEGQGVDGGIVLRMLSGVRGL
jgi:hypothetical protein